MRILSLGKVLLSLAGTPWLILLSTAIPLYLNNRVDLNYQSAVLLPYFFVFFASILVAAVLYFKAVRAQQPRVFRQLLWVYYFLGWAFSAMVALHHMDAGFTVKLGALVALVGALGFLVIFLEKKVPLPKAVEFWAVLSVGLIVTEAFTFYNQPDIHTELFTDNSQAKARQMSEPEPRAQSKKGPNFYHIVLDEFQTDMFSLALSDEVSTHFAGFTLFPETTTQFGRTDMSIPSVFTGKDYDFDTRQLDYQAAAFNGKASFLYWLKEAGYENYAYLHPMWSVELGLFDYIRIHKAGKLIDQSTLNRLFQQLWIYSNLPQKVASRIIDKEDFEQLNNQNMLAPAAPLMSFQSMQLITSTEQSFAENNRYTFAHLIMPHFPYVFDDGCGYDPDRTTATPLTQAECAIELMTGFIKKLKELDRFTDSLIVFQSDHGARFKVEQGHLVSLEGEGRYSIPWSIARSRALLLVKPPGVADDVAMAVSDFEASLVDIAPTVNQLLGLQMDREFSGYDLFSPPGDLQRVRHYHFYKKKGKGGWTDEMTRYRISDSGMQLDGIVELTDNAPRQ